MHVQHGSRSIAVPDRTPGAERRRDEKGRKAAAALQQVFDDFAGVQTVSPGQ